MNEKKEKRIRLHAKVLLLQWLEALVNLGEQGKVTTKDILSKLPEQTHYYNKKTLFHSAYSFKWVVKGIKKVLSRSRELEVEDVSLKDVEKYYNRNTSTT